MKKLLLLASATLLLSACATTAPQESVLVYINSGAIQCESAGKTGAETALLLSNENIAVTKTECGHLANVAMIAMCGGPAANINVHQISSADLAKAQLLSFENVTTLKQEEHLGYDVSACK